MDKQKWPDKKFFWGVMGTIKSEWTKEFIARVLDIRQGKGKAAAEKKIIVISPAWMEQL